MPLRAWGSFKRVYRFHRAIGMAFKVQGLGTRVKGVAFWGKRFRFKGLVFRLGFRSGGSGFPGLGQLGHLERVCKRPTGRYLGFGA